MIKMRFGFVVIVFSMFGTSFFLFGFVVYFGFCFRFVVGLISGCLVYLFGMGVEEIVRRILAVRGDLGREDVLRLAEEKRRLAGGYLSLEQALRVVASELGVDLGFSGVGSVVALRDLVPNLGDVSVAGRVLLVMPVRVFRRQDGRLGKVGRLLLSDGTGTATVVLWDERAELIERGEVAEGAIVRVVHGYT
ncbi:hypothetical protein DRO49_06365, partial [Candidatus Bathyarchaeota archaeon]